MLTVKLFIFVNMISIKKTLVSEDLFEQEFVCDLSACKGACCVEGDGGAPLNEEELDVLESIYENVKPFMSENGIKSVKSQGKWVVGEDGGKETPLVRGKECVYAFFDQNNIAKCAIETAYREGKIKYKKPISCELYPIRISSYQEFDAVNYHKWHICKPACDCGQKLKTPVYKFLQEPLIKKYGSDWYKALDFAAEKHQK